MKGRRKRREGRERGKDKGREEEKQGKEPVAHQEYNKVCKWTTPPLHTITCSPHNILKVREALDKEEPTRKVLYLLPLFGQCVSW